jgi:hypothetical protein
MEKIRKIIQKYPDKKGSNTDYLELAKKDERGVPLPFPVDNPVHRVKLLRGEFAKRDTEFHKDEQGVMLYFEEGDREVKYFVPMLNKEKKFHYLFERFQDIDEGAVLDMEFVKKGLKGFINVEEISTEHEAVGEKVGEEDDIPVVEDETNKGFDFGEEPDNWDN